MPVTRISPEEALTKMETEGYAYLDVRSLPEFEAGHPEGAYNIPLLHMGPNGMTPNVDFMRVVEASFAKDTKIVVGCKAGGRSLRAVEMMSAAGYLEVVDQRAGFSGAADAFGRMVEPGWAPKGLPVSSSAAAGRDFASLKKAAGA